MLPSTRSLEPIPFPRRAAASCNRSKMHATVPTNASFTQLKPLPGYVSPPVRRVEGVVDQPTPIDALYDLMRLSNPRRLSDGSFQMTLLRETGRLYTIQWTQSLSNWLDLVTLTKRTGPTDFIDRQATSSARRFYRAVER